MRKLPFTLIVLLISVRLFSQFSPHGESMAANCTDCHKTSGWSVDEATIKFNHTTTKFPLVGQHKSVSCKACHTSLEFSKAKPDCYVCHNDMHQQTLGNDCGRCHTPNSWLVTNITQLHQQSRFPLIGPHITADCKDCHINIATSTPSSSLLRFDQLGVECYDCHKANYMAATAPNHVQNNYSTNCTDCHNINSFSWSGAGINHNFFPLEGGHDINDCNKCHTSGSYSKIPSECISCHQSDYNGTTNPNHTTLNFSTTCNDCHSLNPGWKPAEYRNHDVASFPIYSGTHNGEWNSCTDCHANSNNYAEFTCISCHEHNKGDTDEEHGGVSGYVYTSDACYACHPTGTAEGSFDHNKSAFPLTGAHTTTDCANCHTNGYAGTPTVCANCHTSNYNQATNPNHVTLTISTDCAVCHTTNPGWNPATFATHNNYYALTGAHVPIANECATCHNGNYTNTPNTCAGCHINNYNQTTNPNHSAINISNDCAACHTTNPGWNPATFATHNNYYVLEGAHAAIANECATCHNGNYTNTPNTCAGCHINNYNQTTNPNHTAAQFPTTCESCHSQNVWTPSTFNHDGLYFPIYSGKHLGQWNTCAECHANPSNYALFNCTSACHPQSETNTSHSAVSGYTYNSDACYACHPTGSVAGAFNHSQSGFPLTGAHTTTDCSTCHTNGYAGTSNVCSSCHINNYNQTSNPNHTTANISTDCATCHTTVPGWTPAAFPTHNNYYVLAGAHINIANECATCHKGNYNSTPNTCAGCHMSNYNQTTDPNHLAAQFPTTCETCHTQSVWAPSTFNHDGLYFPIYSGIHRNQWNTCSECHKTQTNFADFTCTTACHPQSITNGHHQEVPGYSYNSAACYSCHPKGINNKKAYKGFHIDNFN